MAEIPRNVLQRIRRLADLSREVGQGGVFFYHITRLTVLKSLCKEPDVASRFATYLAQKTWDHIEHGKRNSSRQTGAIDRTHRELMSEALVVLEEWQRKPTEALRRRLRSLFDRMRTEQNEHRKIAFGSVRIITDSDLLLFELAVECVLCSPQEAGSLAYQIARHYAERYDPKCGTGLPPKSAPMVQDIADFWLQEFGLTAESINVTPKSPKKDKKPASTRAKVAKAMAEKKIQFTHRQGQFLAFIHLYRKLHRQGPAETDMVRHFRVTPPSVHDMIVRMEQLGLVTRQPGVPRSVQVAIPESELPELEPIPGTPW